MKKISFLLMLFFSLCIIATPFFAHAENNSDDESALLIAEEDLLFQGLQGLIGGAANIIVGGDTPPEPDHLIGQMMSVYGFGLLSFAMIFMIFRFIKWFTQLGSEKKEGSFLDFQSAPLPVAMAVILIMPMADGYSAMQHVVIKVFGEGISLANKEVNVAADYLEKTGSFSINPTVMNSDLIALNMLESAICMSMLNKTSKKNVVAITPIEVRSSDYGIDTYTVSYDGIYNRTEAALMYMADVVALGANGITKSFPEGVCGSTSITFGSVDDKYKAQQPVIAFREAVVSEYTILSDAISEVGADFVDHLLQPNINHTTGELTYNSAPPEALHYKVQELSEKFTTAYRHELSIFIQKLEATSENAESGLANKRATESLRTYGAAYLGAYFWEYARRNNITTSLTALSKSSKPPMYNEASEKTEADAYKKITTNAIAFTQELRKDYLAKTPQFTGSFVIDSSANLEQEITKSIMEAEHANGWGADFMFSTLTASMYSESDPVLAMADTGHQLIIAGEIILATTGLVIAGNKALQALAEGTAMGLASNAFTAPLVPPAWATGMAFKAIVSIAENMIPLALVLITFGALIAFWLPSIPLIHWINGIIGFLIVFMHAFVLTPLLGLAHLLSGEKGILSSKTQHGYMAIIQLFTYMPIMVIAFFISYLICMFGLKFTQVIYLPFMTSLNGDNMAGVVTGLFVTGIFIIISMQVMNRCFSLVTTMTEKAGKFIGGGEEMLGDSGAVDKAKGGFVALSNSSKAGAANVFKGKDSKTDKPKPKNSTPENAGGNTDGNKDAGSSQTEQNVNNQTK